MPKQLAKLAAGASTCRSRSAPVERRSRRRPSPSSSWRRVARPARRATQGRRSVRARARRRRSRGTGAGRRAIRGRAWCDVRDRRAGARRHSGHASWSLVRVRRRERPRRAGVRHRARRAPAGCRDGRRPHGRRRAVRHPPLPRARRLESRHAGRHHCERVAARPARLDRDARDARRSRPVALAGDAGVIVIGRVVSLATATHFSLPFVSEETSWQPSTIQRL